MACVSQCSWMVGQEINSSVVLPCLQACKASCRCAHLLRAATHLPGAPVVAWLGARPKQENRAYFSWHPYGEQSYQFTFPPTKKGQVRLGLKV